MSKLASEKLTVLPKRLEMGWNYAAVGQGNLAIQAMGLAGGALQLATQGNAALITQISFF